MGGRTTLRLLDLSKLLIYYPNYKISIRMLGSQSRQGKMNLASIKVLSNLQSFAR